MVPQEHISPTCKSRSSSSVEWMLKQFRQQAVCVSCRVCSLLDTKIWRISSRVEVCGRHTLGRGRDIAGARCFLPTRSSVPSPATSSLHSAAEWETVGGLLLGAFTSSNPFAQAACFSRSNSSGVAASSFLFMGHIQVCVLAGGVRPRAATRLVGYSFVRAAGARVPHLVTLYGRPVAYFPPGYERSRKFSCGGNSRRAIELL